MRCTDEHPTASRRVALAAPLVWLLAALGACRTHVPADAPAPAPVAARPQPQPQPQGRQAPPARDWAEYRVQAALRLVAANPGRTYTGPVPQPLLAIPVLEIEVNGDGSVRRITVLREPSEEKDTIQLAIDAVRRAAPFGDATRLPRPWKFTETFLFDDDRRFKPRTLDQ